MNTVKVFGKAALCVTAALALLLVTGCGSKTYTADYLKKYTAFLDYSLGKGNWTLADSQKEKVVFADFTYNYTWWIVEYVDAEGVRRTLGFNNYTGSNSDDIHFSNAVIKAAAETSRDRIEKQIAPKFSENGTESNLVFNISNYPLFQDKNSDLSNSKPVVSANDGLKLYDLDTAWIFAGHRFYLEVTGSFVDEELYNQAVSSLYSEIRSFVKADADVFIDLVLVDKNTGAVVQSSQVGHTENVIATYAPEDREKNKQAFEDLLRERYFPKPA